MTSVATSAQLSAVSRQIDQQRDTNRQLLNTIRWEQQNIKTQVERLQCLHGKVDEIHKILKQVSIQQIGIQPLSSVVRFREQHSQTPPKSPTNSVSTQFNDQDGTTDFKPDASEDDSQEGEEVQEEEEEEETEL